MTKIKTVQEDIEKIEVEGASGGGLVKISLKGDKAVKSVFIDPSIIDKENKTMLETLIKSALNDALNHLQEEIKKSAEEKAKEGLFNV